MNRRTAESDRIIANYVRAYVKCNGIEPSIRKNGAWLKINDIPQSFRVSDLPEMTINLYEKIDRDKSYWKTKDPEDVWNIVEYNEKEHHSNKIPNDIIKLFLETLLQKNRNSPYLTELCMKNFIGGGDLTLALADDSECVRCESDHEEQIEALRNELSEYQEYTEDLQTQLKRLKNFINQYKRRLENEEKQKELAQQKYHQLRENSVMFSMDDLKNPFDVPNSNHYDEDDDIPF